VRTVRLRKIIRKHGAFTNSRGAFDRENRLMMCANRPWFVALALTLAPAISLPAHTRASTTAESGPPPRMLAQAMVPPTGMMDSEHPMPMKERMLKRFPQPVRVGDLIGLPVLNQNASTLGHVRQVVRTPQGNIELIVSYSRFWGWFGRPVAVPIEVVGIEGRQLVSLDMDSQEYARAPTWQGNDTTVVPNDATIQIALARS
jgi:PRC-barrel domain